MPFADAQGATVAFDGVTLGSLTNVKGSQAVAGAFDCTSLLSPVVGDGVNTRVVAQSNPTSIDPGSVQIAFIGPTIFGTADIGRVGPLVFSLPSGGALVGLAYLQNVEMEAAVGEKLRGTATFKLTGFYA